MNSLQHLFEGILDIDNEDLGVEMPNLKNQQFKAWFDAYYHISAIPLKNFSDAVLACMEQNCGSDKLSNDLKAQLASRIASMRGVWGVPSDDTITMLKNLRVIWEDLDKMFTDLNISCGDRHSCDETFIVFKRNGRIRLDNFTSPTPVEDIIAYAQRFKWAINPRKWEMKDGDKVMIDIAPKYTKYIK
jgi:hypothetical protein